MKNYSTLKKFGLTAVTLLVCFAVMMTCVALSFPFARAFAEPEVETPVPEAVGASLTTASKIADSVVYGDTFTVPAGATVTAPDGTEVTVTDNKVKADQMGIYTVSFGTLNGAYDFLVRVTLEEDLFLKVAYDGAGIPTFIQKGNSFEIPSAAVKFYDDDKILRTYKAENADAVAIDVTVSNGTKSEDGKSITADKAGKMYVTYSAKLDNGKKYFHKTFTVNVQEKFNDVSDPTLTVAGVSSDISVKRAVTLPKATASDSDDSNLQILITVKDPDGNDVKTVDIDEYGYAYQADDGKYEPIEFDNDQAMTFYPLQTGDYYVTYQAIDDAGHKSAERKFKMTCGDRVAPVFYEIDEENIPETWGLNSITNKEGTTVEGVNAGEITFTVPTLVDNKSHVKTGADDTSDDLIELYFRITDADNNKTILSIEDVLSDSESKNKFTSNSTYKADAQFVNGKFTFEFDKYVKTDSKGETQDIPGTYTVYWRASDKAGNRSSKSYTVELQDTYEDKIAPTVGDLDVPEYVSTVEDGFTVPTPAVSDSSDTRVKVEYTISSGEASVTVKGGEHASFDVRKVEGEGSAETTETYLVFEDSDDELKLGDDKKLTFKVVATDDVGNKTEKSDEMNVIVEDNAKFELNVDDVTVASGSVAGTAVKAGEFKITTSADMRNYTGFEIIAKDVNGDYINLDFETFTVYDNSNATIYVKNIVLHPEVEGKGFIIVRAFDVNGYNTIASKAFELGKASSGEGSGSTQKSAAVIGSDNLVNVKYKLHNEVMDNIGIAGGTYFVARKFEGRAFSLMGSEITFKTASTVYIQDGWIDANAADIQSDYSGYTFDKHFNPYGSDNGKYTANVTDNSAPVIEVQGDMPTYAEKGATVELPSVVAYSDNGKAVVTLEVTHNKSGKKPSPVYDKDTNTYSFKGELDATYTATYTATYGNAEPVRVSYTIDVGDVVGPDFKVTYEKELGRLRVGDKFAFGKIELLSEEDKGNTTGITVRKRLIDPSKEEVSSATVSGSFSTYKDTANNGTDIVLSMNGKYEVEYTVTDAAGNETIYREIINVASKGSAKPTTFTALSITLTVIAVVLLAGVIVYVVRFRKVKSK